MLELKDVDVAVGARQVLTATSLVVMPGESVAVMGPSGSGKTTLLNCAAGIQVPTSGEVQLEHRSLHQMSASARADLRLREIGLVFQDPELLTELTTIENVALGLILQGQPRAVSFKRSIECLELVELADRADDSVTNLSGGEAQRVAVARALAGSPRIIVADEPTASLDEESASMVISVLLEAAKSQGAAVLVATHDPTVGRRCDRILSLRSSR